MTSDIMSFLVAIAFGVGMGLMLWLSIEEKPHKKYDQDLE
jgi:hypothetical protein